MITTRFNAALCALAVLLSLGACTSVVKSGATQNDSLATGTAAVSDPLRSDPPAPAGTMDAAQTDPAAGGGVQIISLEKVESSGSDTVAVTTAPAVRETMPSPAREAIEARVEAALAGHPGFAGIQVSSTRPGAIVLGGTVASEDHKAKAQMIAANVDGVVVVTNNLIVTVE